LNHRFAGSKPVAFPLGDSPLVAGYVMNSQSTSSILLSIHIIPDIINCLVVYK
jgi:hypothetical protein